MRRYARMLRTGGALVGLAAVVGAPLAVGAVHRPALIAVLATVFVAFAAFASGSLVLKRPMRGGRFALLLVVLVALPVLQSIPLPAAIRNAVDPAGAALMEGSPAAAASLIPLSLDPPATAEEVGKAGAALAIFLIAFHIASGRYPRLLVPKAIALTALAAFAIGLGQRTLGIDHIYGRFLPSGGVLVGPLINANHLGELLVLGAFMALAASRDVESRLRLLWLLVAVVLAGGSLATHSRGALVGLVAGSAVFAALRWLRRDKEAVPTPLQHRALAVVLVLALVPAVAIALDAAPVFEELANTKLDRPGEKIALWKDSLRVLWEHPAGIGRGAFMTAYPAYQTLILEDAWVRFPFVENAPLEMLIDTGWLGFAVWATAGVLLIRQMLRRGRKDPIEAALLGGLAALFVHNIADFGFEILGIRLPGAAVLGATVGRMVGTGDDDRASSRRTLGAVAFASLTMLAGLISTARATDFDERIRNAASPADARSLALAGASAHPTDYMYPFIQSRYEPLAPDARGRSPRLHLLNRAMRLCAACAELHRAAARELWSLGRRSQAVGEWKRAVDLTGPWALASIVNEAIQLRATPAEIARLAPENPAEALSVARYLIPFKARGEIQEILENALRRGAPRIEVLLVDLEMLLALDDRNEARRKVAEARQIAPSDARALLALVAIEVADGRTAEALGAAVSATRLDPMNAEAQRRRFDLAVAAQNWPEASAALDGLSGALGRTGASQSEVHVRSSRMWRQRRQFLKAIAELRTATLLEPENPGPWLDLGATAEEAGQVVLALESYRRGLSLAGENEAARAAVRRLEATKRALEVRRLD